MSESRDARTQRLLRDRDAARAAGRRVGGFTPYGWRLGERGTLAPVPHEQHVRWLMLLLRRNGRTYQQISDLLADLGLTTRAGGRWGLSSVASVVNRAAGDGLEDTG